MSSDGSITLEASARFDRLETAMARLQRRNETLEKRLGRLSEGHNKMERSGIAAFDKLVVSAAKVAATYFSIHQAINLVRSAFQDLIEKQKAAVDVNRTFQESLDELFSQMGQFTPAQRQALQERVIDAGIKGGLALEQIVPTFQRAFTGTEGLDPVERGGRALQVFEKSLDVFGTKLAEFPGVQGAILQLERQTGLPQEFVLGQIARFLEQSVAEDPSVIPKVAQAVSAQIIQSGAVTQEDRRQVFNDALAMLTSLMAAGFDPQVAISRTAAVNLPEVVQTALGMKRGEGGGLSVVELMNRFVEEQGEGAAAELKFRGKSFTRTTQFAGFQKSLENTAGTVAENLKTMTEVFNQPVTESVKNIQELQTGADNRFRALDRARRKALAESEVLLRETAGAEGEVVQILFGSGRAGTGAFGTLPFFQRKAERIGLFLDQLITPESQAEELGIRRLAQRFVKDLPPHLAEGVRVPVLDVTSLEGQRQVAAILAVETQDKFLQNLQNNIERLLFAIEAKEREAAIRQQQLEEALLRNAERTNDAVGGTNNAAAAAARVNAEQENP